MGNRIRRDSARSRSDCRVPGRKAIAPSRSSTSKTVALRIANAHHNPLVVSIFQGVFHSHSAIYAGIVFRMKSYGRVGQIILKSDVGSGDIQSLQVKTGAFLKTLNNCFLNFGLRFELAAAS